MQAHFRFVWRLLRRLGLDAASADDAAQRVFLVATRRLAQIRPGSERAFLYGVALRTARDERRQGRRSREALQVLQHEPVVGPETPDEHLQRRRDTLLIDRALEPLALELRAVFVMFELDGMSMRDIAGVIGVPEGTVASRLRRAREKFFARVQKLRREQESPR